MTATPASLQLATLKDAALAAISTFLRSTGFHVPAAAVDEARASADSIVALSVASELQDLATSLMHLVEACDEGMDVKLQSSDAIVDGLLQKVAGRASLQKLDLSSDATLAARLDQALADSSSHKNARRTRVAASGSHGSRGHSNSKLATPVPAPAVPTVQGEPSAHYVPRQPGVPDPVEHDLNIPEEYRDDHDPGYRIREVTEAQLILELQDRYERAFATAPELLPFGGSFGCGSSPERNDGGECPGFGKLPESEVLAPADDELLHSSSEKALMPSDEGGSLLSDLVRSAGSVMASLGAATGMSRSDHDEATDVADSFLLSSAKSADTGDTELPVTAVPSFGVPSEGQSSMSMSKETTAVLNCSTSSQEQAVHGLPAFSYAQPPAAAQKQTLAANATEAFAKTQFVPPAALALGRKERSEKRPCRYAESGDAFYPVELDGIVYDSFSLKVVHERDRTGFEESKDFPIRINSIVAARYQVVEYLGSAAFSRAVQCLDLQTNRMVCMKIIKNNKDFFDQSLDEIKLLKLINANADDIDEKNCLALIDYFYHKEHLIIVTELLRDNLYEFYKFNRENGEEPYFTLGRLQRISRQVLVALEYIHNLWLIHADLKPENVLIKSYSKCEVKVIDFGSSCFVDDQLTNYVQSRSYRAPEVMLGLPYNQKIDIWSLGCIIAELWTGYVLFQNDSVQSLLARILGIIGHIPAHMLAAGRFVPQYFCQDGQLYKEIEPPSPAAHATPVMPERRLLLYLQKRSSLAQRMRTDDKAFLDFLSCLLQIDPELRPTASEALKHHWLRPGRYTDGIPPE